MMQVHKNSDERHECPNPEGISEERGHCHRPAFEGFPWAQVNPDLVGRRCLIYLCILSAQHTKPDMKQALKRCLLSKADWCPDWG